MKKVVKKIIIQILGYSLFLIFLNMIVALVVSHYLENKEYLRTFLLLFSNNSSLVSESTNELSVSAIITIKQILEGIVFAIMGSVIFAYILNRDVRLIFPEKLVIRRRTSEGSEGELTLGFLLGNPGRKWIYDVQCRMHCAYVKSIGDITQWNGETTLKSTVDFIQNYYRFSFKIADLPATFLKHYLEKEEKYIEKDNLYITIVAESDGIRGKFKCEKRYLLQDIVIDLHNPEKQFKSNVKSLFGQKIKTKIDWKEFPKYIEAGEADRAEVIQEIRNIIATKEEEARKKKEKNAIVKE